MTTDFAAIHDELRSVARGILTKLDPRAAGGQAPGPADWQLLADSGWLGLEVPEAEDGAGATFAEVAVILHEMGRAAILSSYLGSTVLGVGALNLLQPGQGRDDLLRHLASGSQKAALVAPTADEAAAPEDATPATMGVFRLEPFGGGLRLYGEARFVSDAMEADTLLVIAGHPHFGLVVVPVDRETTNLQACPQPVLDATRRFGVVTADGVEVSEESVWRFADDAGTPLRKLLDRGALATACDSLGLAETMMEATVAYAGVRKQFDRPIGSFQAVKHACADMLVQVMICRELLSDAVRTVAADDPEAPVAVSMAKSYVCAAAVDVVGKAMQLHGGFGYTWESGIHVYLKRAVLNRSLFGSPSAHRRRLARRYN